MASGPALLQQLKLLGEPPQRLHFRLRFHRLNFHRPLGLLDSLIGKRLRDADFGRNFIVGGIMAARALSIW